MNKKEIIKELVSGYAIVAIYSLLFFTILVLF